MKKIYIIAIVLALISGYMLYAYMGSLEDAYRVNYDTAIVAREDIPERIIITEEMVKKVQLPSAAIQKNAYTEIEDVVGGITAIPLYKEEQIIKQKISKGNDYNSGLSYSVPVGMRAITIPVDEVSGVGGFIRIGDKEGNPVITQLLSNIEVLALGTGPDAAVKQYQPEAPVAQITLLVSPEEALELKLASSEGIISLSLRTPVDDEKIGINSKYIQHLLKQKR